MNKLIGVMDSGLGGLSVLSELTNTIYNADFIYYGDIANSPYGSKSAEQVKKLTSEVCKFLIEQSVDAILIACNTATSVTIDHLRKTYHHIPIFGIEPAIKPASIENPNSKIAVLATSLTLHEDKYEKLASSLSIKEKIKEVNCDGLATLIDKGDESKVRNFLFPKLEEIQSEGIDVIVLGCTHYSLIKNTFLSFNPKFKIYDGNNGTAKHIKNKLGLISDHEDIESEVELYLNGGKESDFDIAQRYLNNN